MILKIEEKSWKKLSFSGLSFIKSIFNKRKIRKKIFVRNAFQNWDGTKEGGGWNYEFFSFGTFFSMLQENRKRHWRNLLSFSLFFWKEKCHSKFSRINLCYKLKSRQKNVFNWPCLRMRSPIWFQPNSKLNNKNQDLLIACIKTSLLIWTVFQYFLCLKENTD